MLPVHGFVLAGGKSSRMGQDKALMELWGRPMVEIAVEKMRTFCATVSIAGNREDLGRFAPVVPEMRADAGPAAGVEAGLRAAKQPWVMFVPVDVPLMPAEVLRRWAEAVLGFGDRGVVSAYLIANDLRQPAFCMFQRGGVSKVTAAIEAGRLRLNEIVDSVGDGEIGYSWGCDAAAFGPKGGSTEERSRLWFANMNTPAEMALVESLSERGGEPSPI
jgi:molybdopterin-guanine dinucleotide biosynthesis protein A